MQISSIEVISVKSEGARSVFEGPFENNNGIMLLDLSETVMSPGVYTITLDIVLEGNQKKLSTSAVFSLVRPIQIKSVSVGITDGKEILLEALREVKTEMSLPLLSASASAFEVLHIVFQITPSNFNLHQNFVKFTNLETNEGVIFNSKKEGPYIHAAISLGLESDTFSYSSGKYSMSILLGDSKISKGIEWIIGYTNLSFPSPPAKSHPLYAKSLLYTSDNTLKALPEITHKMRLPAQRATYFMSSLFTFLSLVPLVFFLRFVFSLKPNLTRLNSLSSGLFVLFISIVLLLYACYWFGLQGFSFYQTIKYLCFLVPITIFVGRASLSSVVQSRHLSELKSMQGQKNEGKIDKSE